MVEQNPGQCFPRTSVYWDCTVFKLPKQLHQPKILTVQDSIEQPSPKYVSPVMPEYFCMRKSYFIY